MLQVLVPDPSVKGKAKRMKDPERLLPCSLAIRVTAAAMCATLPWGHSELPPSTLNCVMSGGRVGRPGCLRPCSPLHMLSLGLIFGEGR